MTEQLIPDSGRDRAGDIAEAISAAADTRHLTLISGGLLTADVTGAAIAEYALLGHGHMVTWVSAALLVPAALAWVSAAARVVMAEQPVAGALSELRRETGAPIEPSAPWHSRGFRQLCDEEIEHRHVAPLIGASAIRHDRARTALSAAIIATGAFLLWAVLSISLTAVT